ncbi:MAG: hypothetical protein ACREN5_12825 [Gemmatimonadales bacterium]
MSRRAIGALALLLGLGLACGEDPVNPPMPGTVRVVLTTPNTGDGAILFVVTGPATPSAAAVPGGSGLRVFPAASLGTTTRFIVTGPLAAGAILTLDVPDVNGTYTASVLEVAQTGTYALRSLIGYSLSVTP